jgi:hypothetical protein
MVKMSWLNVATVVLLAIIAVSSVSVLYQIYRGVNVFDPVSADQIGELRSEVSGLATTLDCKLAS